MHSLQRKGMKLIRFVVAQGNIELKAPSQNRFTLALKLTNFIRFIKSLVSPSLVLFLYVVEIFKNNLIRGSNSLRNASLHLLNLDIYFA